MLQWKKSIEETQDQHGKDLIADAAYDWVVGLQEKHGLDAAQEAHGVIFSNIQPLEPHMKEWAATIGHLDAKTQSLQKLAVSNLCAYFKTNAKIDKSTVKEYLTYLRTEKNLSDKTITIRPRSMRTFMRHMDEVFDTALLALFTSKAIPKTTTAKTAKQRAWIPFTAAEVSKLYDAALAKKPDHALADLIAFGAYTGCRIEELAQLRGEHFTANAFKVEDSKTATGIREVPVHPALVGVMRRLTEEAGQGYLLEGSDEGAFGKRSDALGKRFGKLKTALGLRPQHVFHSIRKTVVSQLEQAGVNENTTADTVGHDKPRITCGLYSSGASMAQKTQALTKVAYRGALALP